MSVVDIFRKTGESAPVCGGGNLSGIEDINTTGGNKSGFFANWGYPETRCNLPTGCYAFSVDHDTPCAMAPLGRWGWQASRIASSRHCSQVLGKDIQSERAP